MSIQTTLRSRRTEIAAGVAIGLLAGVAFTGAASAAEVEYYEGAPTGVLYTTLDTAGVVPSTTEIPAPSGAPKAEFAYEYGLDDDALACGQMIAGIWGVTNIGGYSTSGHVSGSDHYTGNALDVMLTPVTDESIALGWEICDWLVEYAEELNIKYIIFNGQIWEADEPEKGWQPYSHPTGGTSDAYAHHDHIHISFY